MTAIKAEGKIKKQQRAWVCEKAALCHLPEKNMETETDSCDHLLRQIQCK